MVANNSPYRRQRYRDPFEKLARCNQIWIKLLSNSYIFQQNMFMTLHLGIFLTMIKENIC